jgi:hypothetical protein
MPCSRPSRSPSRPRFAPRTFSRATGEEFAIILPEIDGHNAHQFAEKVRRIVETTEFRFEGTKIPVTISMGVSTLDPEEPTAAAIIRRGRAAVRSQVGRPQLRQGLALNADVASILWYSAQVPMKDRDGIDKPSASRTSCRSPDEVLVERARAKDEAAFEGTDRPL